MSEFQSITDRIKGLRVHASGTLVSLDEVLEIVKNAIPIEIDADMYKEDVPGVTDEEKEILAVVSTAYSLLADKAAEFAARRVRVYAEQAGVGLMADADLFEKNKARGMGATSYRDLATRDEEKALELADIFMGLVDRTTREATMGLALSMAGGLDLEAMEGFLASGGEGL